jgi:hypothetical protein
MRFKAIGANPPFNISLTKTGNGTGGDVTIGRRFYKKGLDLLDTDGEYGFIMLKGIMDEIQKESHLEFSHVNYMTDKNYWKYNTCWFHAVRRLRRNAITLSDTIIKKVILLKGNPNWYELNGKVNSKMINSTNGASVRAIVKLPTAKTDAVYSNVDHSYGKLLFGPKVTTTLFDNKRSYMITDDPLCADFSGAYSTNNLVEAEKIKLFVENNAFFKKINSVMNVKGLFWTLRHIKPFDPNQIVTGHEIPKEWELLQSEIDLFLSDSYPLKIELNEHNDEHDDVYINHLRHRSYMSNVERSKNRVKATGEVFTPTSLVLEILSTFSDELFIHDFAHKEYKFLDYACGDGQFLSEFVLKLMDNSHSYTDALDKVYGVDLEKSNCIETIRRLYGALDKNVIDSLVELTGEDIPPQWRCAKQGLTTAFSLNGKILNIVHADGLKYDYSFGTNPSFSFKA